MLAFYKKLLGHPFVYDQIRPRVVGGIDMRGLYEMLHGAAERVVLDVGCGTGDALRHLSSFEKYVGVDTDPIAIDAAKARWGSRPGVSFECREIRAADVVDLAPTGVVLSGVLHHCSNTDAEGILRLASGSPRLVRVVTSDIVFLPGALFNNVLAMMDRGRYCRDPDAYGALARRAGLEVERGSIVGSAPDSNRVQYYIMSLAPAKEHA
jgi:SAM-dependent methyltransferase